jgi:hypothetical protein
MSFNAAGQGAPAGLLAANRDRRPGLEPAFVYDLLGYRRRWAVTSLIGPAHVSTSAPIIVGGCPRSGTTLTQALLGCHREIAAGPESTVFLRRVSRPDELDERFGLPAGTVERLQRISGSQAEFIDLFQRLWLKRKGKTVWAEKTPWNVLRLPFIWRHFPKARFVHVIRDGRAVAASLRRMPWAKIDHPDRTGPEALGECAAYWRRHVLEGLRHQDDPRYFEVRYEDLVAQPEAVLRGLFDFLGVEWDAGVLDGDRLYAALAHVGHIDSNRPDRTIHDGSLTRWRDGLTQAEHTALTRAGGAALETLGYS